MSNTFQSTLPARGATAFNICQHQIAIFQSTLPARGATMPDDTSNGCCPFQSTLPARGATMPDDTSNGCCPFQSTLPARGATEMLVTISIDLIAFQSTLPARGATRCPMIQATVVAHFNPRSPHGERRICNHHGCRLIEISIHAPRTGSDRSAMTLWRAD